MGETEKTEIPLKKNGGRRLGSGRKKKEVGIMKFKRQLKDYLTKEDVEKLIDIAKTKALTDPLMMRFLLEHVFGKAPQPLAGDPDNPLTIKIISYGGDYTAD